MSAGIIVLQEHRSADSMPSMAPWTTLSCCWPGLWILPRRTREERVKRLKPMGANGSPPLACSQASHPAGRHIQDRRRTLRCHHSLKRRHLRDQTIQTRTAPPKSLPQHKEPRQCMECFLRPVLFVYQPHLSRVHGTTFCQLIFRMKRLRWELQPPRLRPSGTIFGVPLTYSKRVSAQTINLYLRNTCNRSQHRSARPCTIGPIPFPVSGLSSTWAASSLLASTHPCRQP